MQKKSKNNKSFENGRLPKSFSENGRQTQLFVIEDDPKDNEK